jgi:hypothetical protein
MPRLSTKIVEDILPEPLRIKFQSDGSQSSESILICNRFADWFDNSGIPFFKNYTDHSSLHSLEVFQSAIEFIDEKAYEHISSEDISILLLSSYCHDSGMHIT